MASKIKGIIVEIGGDTVGLQKALKDVNDKAKNVSSTSNGIVFMMNIENFYNQNKQDLDEIMEYAGNYFSAQMKRREAVF